MSLRRACPVSRKPSLEREAGPRESGAEGAISICCSWDFPLFFLRFPGSIWAFQGLEAKRSSSQTKPNQIKSKEFAAPGCLKSPTKSTGARAISMAWAPNCATFDASVERGRGVRSCGGGGAAKTFAVLSPKGQAQSPSKP